MIEDLIEQTSPKTLALGVVGVWVVILVGRRIAKERKIQALGGHASKVKTWVPYGWCSLLSDAVRPLANNGAWQMLISLCAASKTRSTIRICRAG